MSGHYMTVLGTGNYSECRYADFDEIQKKVKQEYVTRYAQSAVFRFFCSDFEDGDRFTVFVTKEARETHLSTFECEIKKVFGDRKIEFCVVDICEGLNTEDQWRNFNIIYDTISENEAVTVDITHGFRTIPMQLFSILNYARTLKNIAVAGVYYGVFEQPFGMLNDTYIPYSELKEKYIVSERPRKYSDDVCVYYPVADYTGYVTLSDLTSAAYTFAETGDAGMFADISERSKKARFRDSSVSREVRKEFSDIFSLGSDLNKITESVKCSRGKIYRTEKISEGADKSVYNAVKRYKSNIKNNSMTTGSESEARALLNIIKYMDNVINDNFKEIITETGSLDDKEVSAGICVVRWCLRYGLVQAGFTALEETVITWLKKTAGSNFVEEICGGDISEREIRDKIGKYATEHEKMLQSGNSTEEDADPEQTDKFEACRRFMERFSGYDIEKIFILLNQIKQSRNDINHFGFSTELRSTARLKKNLEDYYHDFLETVISGD